MINCPTCKFADFEADKCKRLLNRLPHLCPYAEERKPRCLFQQHEYCDKWEEKE